MRGPRARAVEIESVAEIDRLLAAGTTSMAGWRVQSVDLRGTGEVLRGLASGSKGARGALFLGCTFDPGVGELLRSAGALVFPRVPHAPVDTYRSSLYTPHELYDGLGGGYEQTLDARAYGWTQADHDDLADSLAQALHDHAIDDALTDLSEHHDLVGVMGGHAMERGSAGYREAAALGRALARTGLTVATGGGPGAMEAANLGAYLSSYDEEETHKALDLLAAVPSFEHSVRDWAATGFEVLARWGVGTDSVGIPTWFYGHEPPNPMATRIAKYFKNAIREDVLLSVCTAGIVFLPGRAGTVQEIFQDACENYYASPEALAPMVLVGVDYWTREVPAWPLLDALARERPMAGRVHLVDDLADAVAALDA